MNFVERVAPRRLAALNVHWSRRVVSAAIRLYDFQSEDFVGARCAGLREQPDRSVTSQYSLNPCQLAWCNSLAMGDSADYRICYNQLVEEWEIYQTSEVAAWLADLQAADPKTADLVDDAIYALSCSGPALGRPLSVTT
jgi:hypothetical protein